VVATIGHGRSNDWADSIRGEDFFNRFEFKQEPGGETSPAAIVRDAEAVDVPAFLLQLEVMRRHAEAEMAMFAEKSPNSFKTHLASELEGVLLDFGTAPSAQTVAAAIGAENADNQHSIEHYLSQWEVTRGYQRDPTLARLPWYDASAHGNLALLFLPVACSWDALAYLHWFGADRFRSANAIALGRDWQRCFGAELVAHYGTMLQCVVANPPTDTQTAWKLACEHDLFSPGTLAPSGTLVRHYAQGLLGYGRWFLHERP